MERISKTINLYGAKAHVFRHSCLTFLGTLNTNIKTIQAIAGHSDIQTTMNRYVHKDVSQIQLAGREFGEKVSELLTKQIRPNHYRTTVWTHNNIPGIRRKR